MYLRIFPHTSDQYNGPDSQVTTRGVDDYLGFTVSDSAFSWIVRNIQQIHIISSSSPTSFIRVIYFNCKITCSKDHYFLLQRNYISRRAALALVHWSAPTRHPSSLTASVPRSPVAFLSLPYSSLPISCLPSLPTSSWSWLPG